LFGRGAVAGTSPEDVTRNVDRVEGTAFVLVSAGDTEGDPFEVRIDFLQNGTTLLGSITVSSSALTNDVITIDTTALGFLPAQAELTLRMTPRDQEQLADADRNILGLGAPGFVAFTVDNTQPPPGVRVDKVTGIQSGDVFVPYALTDLFSYPCDVTVSYSIDGGATFAPATLSDAPGTEPLAGLASSPAGAGHVFVWDSLEDLKTQVIEDVILDFSATNIRGRTSPTGSAQLIISVDNGLEADLAVGQPTLETSLIDNRRIDPGQTGDVAVANGALWVADREHSRVLRWDTVPRISFQGADLVLGQRDFASTAIGVSLTGFFLPDAIAVSPELGILAVGDLDRDSIDITGF
ncbi:MAG: hypothetical protein L0206_24070, partial [Actinobacteria bacterium]|nr:hypothetical protein [Actinomycetota bacterium]